MRTPTNFRPLGLAAALALALTGAGCVSTATSDEAATSDAFARMLAGRSAVEGDALDAKLAETSAFPLGSRDNPVRASGPAGQRAYLARLRCEDLARPEFYRRGSAGLSPYGNIVDIYVVTCASSEPAEREIYIDMYHAGHVEAVPVPGYGIVGGREGE